MQITVTLITSVTPLRSIFSFSLKDESSFNALFISHLTDLCHFFIAFFAIIFEQKKTRHSSAFSQNSTTKTAAFARYFSPHKPTVFFLFTFSSRARICLGSIRTKATKRLSTFPPYTHTPARIRPAPPTDRKSGRKPASCKRQLLLFSFCFCGSSFFLRALFQCENSKSFFLFALLRFFFLALSFSLDLLRYKA